jgi:hypothetical protein
VLSASNIHPRISGFGTLPVLVTGWVAGDEVREYDCAVRLNNPDQLRLIRPAPQRPEPEPIDTLEAVGAIRSMAFPAAR